MRKNNDKSNATNISGKGQINRVGTPALIAAASLLGTALGVSDAVAAGTHASGSPPHASSGPSSQEKGKATGKATFLKYELKNVAITSHVSAKKPSHPHTKVVEPVAGSGKAAKDAEKEKPAPKSNDKLFLDVDGVKGESTDDSHK